MLFRSGIGAKTATRLAFYTISMSDEDVNDFAKNLLAAKRELTYCSVCGRLTDDDPCIICTDETRDRTKILVVEDSKDVSAMEKIQEYRGLYHVLQGLISPMNGVGPDDINLKSLITRLMDSEVDEVIIATNATAPTYTATNSWVRQKTPLPSATASSTSSLNRSEERRVGKECRIGCRSRWSPYH